MHSPDVLPGYPERAGPAVQARAATLIAAGWAPHTHTARPTGVELDDHARRGGAAAVAAWLDELATGQNAPITDLDAHRTHRTRRGRGR